jgi:hypothetical protein
MNLPTEAMKTTALLQTPYHWAAAYGLTAVLLLVLGALGKDEKKVLSTEY